MFSIRISDSDQRVQRVVWFAHDEISIGRTAYNDLRLDDSTVSKRHARIVVKDGKYILVDLKSTNGTYINKRKLRSPLVIKPERDTITISHYELTISETTNPGIEPARPASRNSPVWTGDSEPTDLFALPFPAVPGPTVSEDELVLLDFIHDAPDDDDPRLVYGDWLTQRGNPRGELIALQCLDCATVEISSLPARRALAGDPHRTGRSARIEHLLRAHGRGWLAPLSPTEPLDCQVMDGSVAVALDYNDGERGSLRAHLQRGFLAYPLCVTAGQLGRLHPAVFRLTPTIYLIERRISRHGDSGQRLYQGQIIGPTRAAGQVAVRCSADAASLRDPRDRGYYHQRQHMSALWTHYWRLGSLFDHDNIARMRGLGYWGLAGDLALVTDWIDGVSLAALVEGRQDGARALPGAALAAVGYQCLLALEHMRATDATSQGIALESARLTLTPDQVIVDRAGVVKIIDLPWRDLMYRVQGESELRWGRGHIHHEQYAAPELRPPGAAAAPSDTYHVGSMLYQLAGGSPPGYHGPVAPRALDAIVRRAMADDPGARYPSSGAMRAALADAFAGPDAGPDARHDAGRDALRRALYADEPG